MDCDHLETTNGNIGLLVLVKLWFGISRGERELVSDIEKGNKELPHQYWFTKFVSVYN